MEIYFNGMNIYEKLGLEKYIHRIYNKDGTVDVWYEDEFCDLLLKDIR